MDRITHQNLHELLFSQQPDMDLEQLNNVSTKQLDALLHQAPIANGDGTFSVSSAVLACSLMLAKTIAATAHHNFDISFEEACGDIVQRIDHLLHEWCQVHSGGN